MRQFGERAGKRRGKKAMALLASFPAAEGWKPRASPAIGARKDEAAVTANTFQAFLPRSSPPTSIFPLTLCSSSAASSFSCPFLNKKPSKSLAPHLQGGKIQFSLRCSRAFRQLWHSFIWSLKAPTIIWHCQSMCRWVDCLRQPKTMFAESQKMFTMKT